jgi:hypothetical protein
MSLKVPQDHIVPIGYGQVFPIGRNTQLIANCSTAVKQLWFGLPEVCDIQRVDVPISAEEQRPRY